MKENTRKCTPCLLCDKFWEIYMAEGEAIRLYEQAIEVDQTAYPDAYSNLALLSAHVKQYDNAIYHMKKYLLLVPDASDARGARDKIYEWEAQIAR